LSNTASGRRRASTPVAEARPRDAHRRERAERIASQAAASSVAPAIPAVAEFKASQIPVPSCAAAPLSRRESRGGIVASTPAMRPRDAQRIERRRRAVTARRDVSFAGLSQKVAIAAAASGMVLTVALPTTAAVVPAESPTVAAAEQEELQPVQAAAGADVSFDRAALHGEFDPDAKLAEIVSASGGDIVTAESKGSLAAPLDSVVMSSPFGTRVSPITGAGELHTGQDMSEACGTAVKAAAAGTVTFAGWHAYGGGNRVVVKHANGLETTYNHLSAIDVTVGQVVERSEAIARVGSTGASTGCHLHFEVLVDGKNVDPLGWL
jgi:murein DD-endopeptidase MepM/ murein hydrolase activator NlpD